MAGMGRVMAMRFGVRIQIRQRQSVRRDIGQAAARRPARHATQVGTAFCLPLVPFLTRSITMLYRSSIALTAVALAAAPVLDGNANDAAWAAAKLVSVAVSDGANFGGKGGTTATIKAVYSGVMFYFLIQCADPTNSIQRTP
jgi:hypothetical protein